MARRRRPVPQDEDTSVLDSLFFDSPENKPVQRNAANARERARMRVLSSAFSRLKTSLPWVPPDTKLSKLDTLRLAATYIAHLRKVLREEDGEEVRCHVINGHPKKTILHPVNFAWPFTMANNKPCPSSNGSMTSAESTDSTEASEMQPTYQSYPPCEYMTLDYSEQPRTEIFAPFPH